MSFAHLIIDLYERDEITFDADGTYNLSPLAIVDIQRHIWPRPLLEFDLTDTLAFKVIQDMHRAIPKQPDIYTKASLRMH